MILDTTYLATLIGLFVILSPGLLLTLPALSLGDIQSKGISTGAAGSATLCASVATGANCIKAHDVWASGYTSHAAVLVHSLVFALVLYMLPQYVGLRTFDNSSILTMTALFAVLSPGLLLTLPALTKVDCGIDGKKVAEADGANQNEYCDAIAPITSAAAPKCNQCTSWFGSNHTAVVPVLVHSLVFGTAAYFVAKNYL